MRILLALLLATTCCASQPWTTQDKVLEGAFDAALLMDYRQTSNMHEQDWRAERNPTMGWRPAQSTINTYFLSAAVLHVVIADQLHGGWRTAWQAVWIAAEVGTVQRNYRLGIRLNF
jgi:hypothetical protein